MITISCIGGAGGIAIERIRTGGRVVKAFSVAEERRLTIGRVEAAGCVVKERLKTNRSVADARCKAEERVITFSGVGTGIAAVRWRAHGEGAGHEGKARGCEKAGDFSS